MELQLATAFGITEQGDAGLDFDWFGKVMRGTVHMAVLITKRMSPVFRDKVMTAHNEGKRLILHCTCTGLAGTPLEPNSPSVEYQLGQLKALIDDGFPIDRCVIRIDPIVPGMEAKAKHVLDTAIGLGLLPDGNGTQDGYCRLRYSIIDDYKHVKARFTAAGLPTIYPGTRFQANKAEKAKIGELLRAYPNLLFESCAEHSVPADNTVQKGCISKNDLTVLGLRTWDRGVNPQKRGGCLCLTGKKELLTNRKPCPNKCLYCFWQDRK